MLKPWIIFFLFVYCFSKHVPRVTYLPGFGMVTRKEEKTYNAADCDKPHDDVNGLRQRGHVRPNLPVHSEGVEELQCDVEVEDGRHADRAEEADKDGMAHLLDLRDVAVGRKHPRQAAEQQDQDAQRDEAVEGHDIVVEEARPGTHGAVPHEDADVEKHVDSWLERVVERLEAEPVVPGENVAGDEAREHVVAADHATGSRNEERERDGEDEEAFAVDVLVVLGPMQQLLGHPADDGAVRDTEQDGLAPRLAEPHTHGRAGVAAVADVLDQVEREEEEGVTQAVVGAGLGHDDLLQVLRHVAVGEAALDNDVGEDGVGGCDARPNRQGVQEAEVWHQRPDKQAGAQPHAGHNGTQEDGQRLPLLLEVPARQLDAGQDQLHAIVLNESAAISSQVGKLGCLSLK